MSELAVALLVALRIGLPGWAWSRSRSSNSLPAPERTTAAVVSRAGRAIALGLVLNLLPALCVAQLSWWSPVVDWGLWGSVTLAGLVWRRRSSRAGSWVDAVCVIGFLALVTAAVLSRAPRSEWFAGGWDPGLYQNAAVVVARADGFAPRTGSVYSVLTREERLLFGPEAFPAVPLDAETGALQHYFFQLTPMCGALFYRWGGLDLLSRMNQVLALMGLPVLVALASALGVVGWRVGAVLLALCVSPLWWYQQAIPTTEMLQFLLLCGAIVAYLDAERRAAPLPLAAALLLAAIGVNHFGFPTLVAVLLFAAAAAEAIARRPGRAFRLATCAVGLAAGLAWDLVFSSVTIANLQAMDGVLSLVLLPFAACLVAGALMISRGIDPRLERWAGALARRMALAAGALLILLATLLSWPVTESIAMRGAAAVPLLGAWLFRFERFLLFHGPAWFLLLGVGTMLLALDTTEQTRRLRVLATALGGVVLLLFLHPGIAPLYPWAFRRSVVFFLPLTALVLGSGLTAAAGRWRLPPQAARAAPLVLVAALLVVGARASRSAAEVGDYVGFPTALETLNRSVRDGDVLVADDPRVATPLLLLYGRDVVNGSPLWKSRSPEYREKYLRMLRRLQSEQGRRIVWLSSTKAGLGVYRPAIGATTPVTQPLVVTYRTVIQHPKAGRFATREVTRWLQLHQWQPQE